MAPTTCPVQMRLPGADLLVRRAVSPTPTSSPPPSKLVTWIPSRGVASLLRPAAPSGPVSSVEGERGPPRAIYYSFLFLPFIINLTQFISLQYFISI